MKKNTNKTSTFPVLLAILVLPLLARGLDLQASAASTKVPSSKAPCTLDQALEWAKAQDGQFLDLDGRYGAQCSDLATAYMGLLEYGDPFCGMIPVVDASYYPTLATRKPSLWEVLPGTATPLPGDIFVSKGSAYYGHVGLVLESHGGTALVLDQNSIRSNEVTGHSGYLHETNWQGSYEPTHLIRFRAFEVGAEQAPPGTPSRPVLAEVQGRKVTILFTQGAGSTGTEVSFSRSPRFTTQNRIRTRKEKAILRSLPKRRRFYVRLRSYRDTEGGRIYGAYSEILSFRLP